MIFHKKNFQCVTAPIPLFQTPQKIGLLSVIQHTRTTTQHDREIEIEQWHPGELVQFSLSVNCIASPGLKKKFKWGVKYSHDRRGVI